MADGDPRRARARRRLALLLAALLLTVVGGWLLLWAGRGGEPSPAHRAGTATAGPETAGSRRPSRPDARSGVGAGAGAATVAAPSSRGLRFEISGTGRGLLLPGGADVPIDLVFTNANPVSIRIASATVRIVGAAPAGCPLGAFAVTRQLTATPLVRARSRVSLAGLGVPTARWPQVRMLDNGDQDACRGATVKLAFAGSATVPR
jgi:hypothetical protein